MTGVYVHHIWLSLAIIRLSGDIEGNPGPKCNSDQSFFNCRWNFNSNTRKLRQKAGVKNWVKKRDNTLSQTVENTL